MKNQEKDNSFKIKNGYCQIFNDKIVITREGVKGNISKLIIGNNISRVLIIYSLIAIGNLYSSIICFLDKIYPQAIIVGLTSIIFFFMFLEV